MKHLLFAILIFSSPLIAGRNNLDKTFLDIALTCKTLRFFYTEDKSEEVEKNCIKNRIIENNLSEDKYNKWSKEYFRNQKEAWDKFLKNLEQE